MPLPVIVVGGGPGGSATALSLRAQGVPVLVLEQATFPRDKVCGDVLLPSAQTTIGGLGADLLALRELAYLCTGCHYTAPTGRSVAGVFRSPRGQDTPWWMVKRSVLDSWLIDQARRSGAEVREGWRVESLLGAESGPIEGVVARSPTGERERLPAAAVVGADGAGSIVARGLKVAESEPQHVCVAARTYATGVDVSDPYLEVFTTDRTLPGCAWIVPVNDREVNVGLGLIRADAARLGTTPRRMFEEACERLPALAARMRGAVCGDWKGWYLPGASLRRPLTGPGALLVGDAGACIDPFTGHGIHHALIGGQIAGDVLAGALREDTMHTGGLEAFAPRCREAFLQDAWTGQKLQSVHGRANIVNAAVRVCAAHPGARAFLMAVVGHSAPRDQLFSPVALARFALGVGAR